MEVISRYGTDAIELDVWAKYPLQTPPPTAGQGYGPPRPGGPQYGGRPGMLEPTFAMM